MEITVLLAGAHPKIFTGPGEGSAYLQAMYNFWLTLTHCGRVTQICVFNTVKLGTSASSP